MRPILVFVWLALTAVVSARTADLSVTADGATEMNAGPAQEFVLPVTFLNRGPDEATGVRVHVEADGGATLLTLYLDATACPGNATSAVCVSRDLAPNGLHRFGFLHVNARAPLMTNVATVRVRVSSDVPDPNLTNNIVTFSLRTIAGASLRPFVSPHAARLEPGQRATFTTAVSNVFATLPGTTFTLRFTAVNATIEEVAPARFLWTCSIDSPTEAVCTARPSMQECCFQHPLLVTVRGSEDPGGGQARVDVRATTDIPDPFPDDRTRFTLETYRMIAVTTTADAGEGSLRAALEDANGHCTPGPCKIVFRLPPPVPAEGWFTITPAEPLPPFTGRRLIIDGETQTALTGDTNPRGPEIAIDGHLARTGLVIDGPCDGGVRGLALGNFSDGYGLTVTRSTQCRRSGAFNFAFDSVHVSRNHIGVDPTATVPWPNFRGLRFDDSAGTVNGNVISGNRASGVWIWSGGIFLVHNRIGVAGDGISAMPNGASGVFIGPDVLDTDISQNVNIHQNIIANHPQMGVAAARGARKVSIRENSMHNNGGLGIDWGLDGVSPPADDLGGAKPSNPPVLLSAVYEPAANQTVVTVSVTTQSLVPNAGDAAFIDIYSNGTADGDGEWWVAGEYAAYRNGTPFTIRVPGNHTGRWLNATSTRIFTFFSRPPEDTLSAAPNAGPSFGLQHTSEFSNAIRVTTP